MALTDSLISYWKLDEASGQRNDSHGTNHLTDNNTVTQAAGKINNAASFIFANSESLSVASNASLQCGDIDFTVSAWVWLDTIQSQQAIVARMGQEFMLDYSLSFGGGLGRFVFRVFQGAGATEKDAVADVFGVATTNTWYHLLGWHDAALDTAYISVNNGAANTVATGGALSSATAVATMIGARTIAGQRFLTGRVDEVAFWKRILTAQERADLYNGGAGLAYESFLPVTGTLAATEAQDTAAFSGGAFFHPDPEPITGERWPDVTGSNWAEVS